MALPPPPKKKKKNAARPLSITNKSKSPTFKEINNGTWALPSSSATLSCFPKSCVSYVQCGAPGT